MRRTYPQRGRRHSASGPAPYLRVAVIAKVEPLTPARALRGPFDYRVPAAMEGVEVGSMLRRPVRPPAPARGRGRARRAAATCRPSGSSSRSRRSAAACPPSSCRLGLWVAEEYCSTPARGLALVLPPGTGTGECAAGRDPARARRGADGRRAGRRSGAVAARRLGERQRAALEALAAGPLAGGVGRARRRRRPLDPALARGARPRDDRVRRAAPPTRGSRAWGRWASRARR